MKAFPSRKHRARSPQCRLRHFEALEQRDLLAASFTDPGFENPVLANNQFVIGNTGPLASAAWALNGGAGMTHNTSAFQNGGVQAPEGQQFALIQGTGTITQTGSGFVPGQQYTLTISRALRNSGPTSNDLRVFIDGAMILNNSVTNTAFADVTTLQFTPATSTPVLRLQATNPAGGDQTTFVDNIRINTVGAAPTGQVNAPTLNNPSFELGPTNYASPEYGPTFNWANNSTNSGSNPLGGAFNNNAPIPQGSRVGFIQGSGTLTNVISGLVPGESYVINYFENERGTDGAAVAGVSVLVDGATVVAQHNVTRLATYRQVQSLPFVATGTSAVLTLRNVGLAGDNAALFDNITIRRAGPVVTNFSFEAPALPANGFVEQSPATGWTGGPLGGGVAASGPGIVRNGSAYGNAPAPEGVQAGLLKSAAFMEQTITGFEPGAVYSVTYYLAPRTTQSNTITVKANGATIEGPFAVPTASTAYLPHTTTTFTATSTSMTLRYESTNTGDISAFVDDVRINLINDVPNATAGGPYTISEGQPVTLSGSGYDVDGDAITSYTWDINNDGTFGDATGQTPTLTWAQLNSFGIKDNGTFPIALRVSSGTVGSASSAGSIIVTNAPPTGVLVTQPNDIAPFQELSFTFALADPSPIDSGATANATFTIDWDGAGPEAPQVVTGPANGTTVNHVFTTADTFNATVIGKDKDGASSGAIPFVVDVKNVFVDDDGNLTVGGTDSSDRITIAFNGGFQVRLNNKLLGTFPSDTQIFVFGGDGNDTITVSSNVPLPVIIDGGEGNDYLTGGPKADTLIGGPGNDRLLGSGGSDVLMGGDDNDTLSGGAGEDMLDGGDGNDTLNGDAGDDVLLGGNGNNKLAGGIGNDVLFGGDGMDTLDGGAGNDILDGGGNSDKLYGRDGRDLIIGGLSADTLYGGGGDDLLIGDGTSYDAGTEDDIDSLMAAMEILRMQGSSADFSSYFDDTTVTPQTPDVIYGEAGIDRFLGADDDLLKDRKSNELVDKFAP